jgi:ribosome-associated toxin RatA of RatAB toxin-antitoxin module
MDRSYAQGKRRGMPRRRAVLSAVRYSAGMIRRAWICGLLLGSAAAAGVEDFSVETARRGGAVEVRAYAVVAAARDTVWSTLVDYDALAGFVPGLRSSRVLERRGASWVVEQKGETRFLVFTFPIEVTLLATARPPDALDVRLLKGNLRRLDGGYRLAGAGEGRTALRWTGLVEPESLPPLLGELVIRARIEAQFAGMVREIELREARRRAGSPPR